MHHRRSANESRLLAASLVLVFATLACTASGGSLPTATPATIPTRIAATPTESRPPTSTTVPTRAPTATRPAPTPSPTWTAIPTRVISTAPVELSAPLYLIDSSTKQIVRLEIDGKTVTQITSEAKPVSDFDVSPADGALVYVSDNDLVLTDAMGRNRQILVNGDSLNEKELTTKDYWTRIIDAPRWSPDGKQIAFGFGGINLIAPTGGKPQLIQPNDPNDFDPVKSGGARRFRPVSWSPDGTRLLLQFSWYIEAGGHAVKNLGDGRLVELESTSGLYYTPFWNMKGTQVYRCDMATGLAGYCEDKTGAGLYAFDAGTGQKRPLIVGVGGKCTIVKSFYQAKDGQLFMFMAFATTTELFSQSVTPRPLIRFGMYRAAPDATNRTELRSDIYNVWDALWSPDAVGSAIISGKTSWWDGEDENTVMWVPIDSTKPPVLLPVNGSNLRWGK